MENTKADILSKLASSITIEQRGKFLLKHRVTPSYDTQQVFNLSQEETWMTSHSRSPTRGNSPPQQTRACQNTRYGYKV
ncbi:hypothetical protein J1N35_014935 [Gossypium stocksii]|uniref:Uncharacterized protein n=1 Tax=Gossypium stocksii TaxID=47602 RepID=A0A9D4A9V0_9ROSI|nr:hypothetical protein J1N35_014935 [Gossypium stocksii]